MYRYQRVSHSLMKASLFSDIHLKKALHSYISRHAGHLCGAKISECIRYQKVSHSLMKASLFSDIHLKKVLHSFISPHSGHLWGAHIPNKEYDFLVSSHINAVYLMSPVIEV
jgi:hypothetical protein